MALFRYRAWACNGAVIIGEVTWAGGPELVEDLKERKYNRIQVFPVEEKDALAPPGTDKVPVQFTAVDQNGSRAKGAVEASTMHEAASLLRLFGYSGETFIDDCSSGWLARKFAERANKLPIDHAAELVDFTMPSAERSRPSPFVVRHALPILVTVFCSYQVVHHYRKDGSIAWFSLLILVVGAALFLHNFVLSWYDRMLLAYMNNHLRRARVYIHLIRLSHMVFPRLVPEEELDFRTAGILMTERRTGEALALVERHRQGAMGEAQWCLRVAALHQRARNGDAAIELARRAVELEPDQPNHKIDLAISLLTYRGGPAVAEANALLAEVWKHPLGEIPQCFAAFGTGLIQLFTGNPGGSLNTFNMAIARLSALPPNAMLDSFVDYVRAWNALGMFRVGREQEAQAEYRALKPGLVRRDDYIVLALLAHELGDKTPAGGVDVALYQPPVKSPRSAP